MTTENELKYISKPTNEKDKKCIPLESMKNSPSNSDHLKKSGSIDTDNTSSESGDSDTSDESEDSPEATSFLSEIFDKLFMTTEEHPMLNIKKMSQNTQRKRKNVPDLLQELIYVLISKEKRHHQN